MSVKKILKLFASGGVPELSEGFCLYLAYSFSGYLKALSNLLKSAGSSVVKTEAESEHFRLAVGKRSQNLVKLLL